MTKEAKLEIGDSLVLIKHDYTYSPPDVSFEFTERASDFGECYSDIQTEVELDKEKAIEIVSFLTHYFDLNGADFSGAEICHGDFSEANFRWADFSTADLRDTNLRGADLREAIWDETTIWPDGLLPLP